jgi:hypothetical protein
MGREIESGHGICRVVLKNKSEYFFAKNECPSFVVTLKVKLDSNLADKLGLPVKPYKYQFRTWTQTRFSQFW